MLNAAYIIERGIALKKKSILCRLNVRINSMMETLRKNNFNFLLKLMRFRLL